MSTTNFDSTDPAIFTIVHQACGDHPKLFVALGYRVDLLLFKSDSGVSCPKTIWVSVVR